MNINLRGKVAIVTGGATGIGKGIAVALSKANAKVIITSRQNNEINKTLKKLNDKCIGFNLDVTKTDDLDNLYQDVIKHITVSNFK